MSDLINHYWSVEIRNAAISSAWWGEDCDRVLLRCHLSVRGGTMMSMKKQLGFLCLSLSLSLLYSVNLKIGIIQPKFSKRLILLKLDDGDTGICSLFLIMFLYTTDSPLKILEHVV